jgi:hypothetical protein
MVSSLEDIAGNAPRLVIVPFATSTGRRDTHYLLATFVLESGQGT